LYSNEKSKQIFKIYDNLYEVMEKDKIDLHKQISFLTHIVSKQNIQFYIKQLLVKNQEIQYTIKNYFEKFKKNKKFE
jgi:hypothetical protein